MLDLKKIISLCKRRGFIYPASEIYGRFANSYSYGPYGSILKNNLINSWLRYFVYSREDMVLIDSPIILHPKVWQSSGHINSFSDALVDCKEW